MKHYIRSLIFLLFLSTFSALQAQGPRIVEGEIILQLRPGKVAAKLDGYFLRSPQGLYTLDYQRCLSASMQIYLFRFDHALSGNAILRQIQQIPGVNWAQFNHYLDSRSVSATTPDDSQFPLQWNLHNIGQDGGTVDADVDAVEAWDLNTGGVDANGDSLVIAIVDDGFDLGHADLHFWKNRLEIPNNGIDDDNNGYVDDVDGWNGVASNGNITTASHGTHVAGIAAARGNNMLGVSGVNWGLQIMPVIATPGTEADAVEAYAYILDMRRLYDQSNGSEGAYVVATNSSFGINNADPTDFPLWCAMYDSLGQAGILNAVSTMNSGVNVDQVGDVPSTCDSEYMLAVTASDRNDLRSGGAAYGPISIDLAAPGVNILSTIPGSAFGTQTGTSMAAPHVAGAAALLLSHANTDFLTLYRTDPAATVLLLRDMILDGADQLPSLQGDIASEGRLNLFRSLQLLDSISQGLAANCLPPTQLDVRERLDTAVTAFWQPITVASPYQVRFREVGGSSWTSLAANDTFVRIGGLTACAEYEFQVAPACAPAGTYVFTGQFQTEGCCEAPQGLRVEASSDSSLALTWQSVFGADEYRLQYQIASDTNWQVVSVNDTSFLLSGLSACTPYQIRVGSRCGNVEKEFSPVLVASTGNCACSGSAYCPIGSGSANGEWIDSVSIGDFVFGSGRNDGYAFFPEVCFALTPDSTYELRLQPGYASFSFREAWRIWIDLNQDGDFSDEGELVFDPQVGIDSVLVGSLTVPADAQIGPTRMRVGMQFAGFSGVDVPESCESPDFGEFEDYCVSIESAAETCPVPCGLNVRLAENDTSILASWAGDPTANYLLYYRLSGQGDWQQISVNDTTYLLSGLSACTSYTLALQSICGADSSLLGPADNLSTKGCASPIDPELAGGIQIYPNPFSDLVKVESEWPIQSLRLYDLQGRALIVETAQGLEAVLDAGSLSQGLYILSVETLRGTLHRRVVKQ